MKVDKLLRQTAVYWSGPVRDGFGGTSWGVPVEVKCRWEERQEEVLNKDNEQVLSRAVVYVGTEVSLGGMLALKQLIDLTSSQDPTDNDAYEIIAISTVWGLRNGDVVRKVWLR